MPLSPASGHAYRELITALLTLAPPPDAKNKPAVVYADDEGHELRRQFMRLVERLNIDPSLPTVIRETAPKWSGLLARLTLIFHLVGLAESMTEGAAPEPRELCHATAASVTMAATFLRRIALPNLFRLGFDTLPEEGAPATHARWLCGHILAHQAIIISARDIGRSYRPLRGKFQDTNSAMAILVDAGWATPAESRSDGARWSINPAVHVQFAAAAKAELDRRAHVQAAIRKRVTDL